MNPFKFISMLAVALVAACSFTSCIGLGEEPVPEAKLMYFTFEAKDNFVASRATGAEAYSLFGGAKTEVVIDMNSGVCNIKINDITYSADAAPVSMLMQNIQLTSQADPFQRGVQIAGPFAFTATNGTTMTIKNLNMAMLLDENRTFGTNENNNQPKLAGCHLFLSFVVNDKYEVRLIMKENHFYGKTTSMSIDGTFPTYTSAAPKYNVSLNPTTGTADVNIEGARFMEAMPKGINMTFPGVPFTITPSGISLFSADVIPTSGGRPFPPYKAVNLTGKVANDRTFDLNFTCPTISIKDQGVFAFNITVDATYSLFNAPK